jgi:hypothetical protein
MNPGLRKWNLSPMTKQPYFRDNRILIRRTNGREVSHKGTLLSWQRIPLREKSFLNLISEESYPYIFVVQLVSTGEQQCRTLRFLLLVEGFLPS